MSKSRIHKSMQTAVAGIAYQIVVLVFSFVSRTIFIRILGSEYLGINGLFSNILTILSLAELGFGSAINYCLYKPLAENDEDKIAALMNFYKKIYNTIAIVVFIVGISLTPFLDYLVNTDKAIPHLKIYYILILLQTVVSYCFVYKMALFNANQEGYLVTNYGIFTYVLQFFLQNIFLILTHNFSIYLIMSIVCTLLNNILISRKADKTYAYLNKKIYLEKKEKKEIFKSVKSLFIYRVGGVFLNGTDNILISVMIGTAVVGIYSNYLMIVNAVKGFVTTLFRSVQASIGNLSVSESKDKQIALFKVLDFLAFVFYGGCAICFWALLNEFIFMWLGEKYLLDEIVVAIIVLNFYIPGTLEITTMFRDAIGLFNKTKYVFLLTAIINMFLSIMLGKVWGLAGILAATIFARLLTNFFYEPWVLHYSYFNSSVMKYFVKQIFQMGIIFCTVSLLKVIFRYMGIGFGWFILKVLLTGITVLAVFWCIYHKTQEYRYIHDNVLNPRINQLIKFVKKDKKNEN